MEPISSHAATGTGARAGRNDATPVFDVHPFGVLTRALVGEGWELGFDTRKPTGHYPLAYGRHPLYYELSSRGVYLAMRGSVGSMALTPVAPGSAIDMDGPTACVLRPDVVDADRYWRALRRVSADTGITLIVKSVDRGQAAPAIRQGLRRYSRGEYWSRAARWDDQTFPEVVLDLARPWHASAECPGIAFQEYEGSCPAEIARDVTRKWLKWYRSRRPEFDPTGIEDYYAHALSDRIVESADLSFVGWWREVAVAFALVSRVSEYQADLWVCISAPGPRLLSRCFHAFIASSLAVRGLRYLNLGGSELASLFKFRQQLGGQLHLHRTHLVVTPG